MFGITGRVVARHWLAFLIGWTLLFAALLIGAPSWESVGRGGQFSYLPPDAASRRAEKHFHEAFGDEQPGSTVLLIVSRDGELSADDLAFIENVIVPRANEAMRHAEHPSVFERVRSPGGPSGLLLRSRDKQAALIVIELKPEFLDKQNWSAVDRVESLVKNLRGEMPPGLSIALGGSAALGRDIGQAEVNSGRAIQRWTIIVVAALLLLVYRAPLVAAIPLLTFFIAIETALRILAFIAEKGDLGLYQGVSLYVTVVGYGAGVDYCVFLIGRSKEEWTNGRPLDSAVGESIRRVGPAIMASAATVALGVAMMGFAQFGKMRQAGFAIALSLAVMLVAALTLAPALLCLARRWAFWPARQDSAPTGWTIHFWQRIGKFVARHPATVWCGTVGVMAPFAIFGAWHSADVTYDVTRNIPRDSPSAAGLRVLQEHYPSGATGPVTAVIHSESVDFHKPDSDVVIEELNHRLMERADELGIVDIRSILHPLGTGPEATLALTRMPAETVRQQAASYYVGAAPGGHFTRMDIVLSKDPFEQSGLDALNRIRHIVTENPSPRLENVQVELLGISADVQDLKSITTHDRGRINVLVVVAVLAVLLLLLRRPVLSIYLILTVVLGYITTLGITQIVFRVAHGSDFVGLDWKAPLFLFTILVAVGEDYNILLVSRVNEEVQKRGLTNGVVEAVAKTGGVITSCGLIMAGTFATLLAGSLSEMHQMGFALAFGVLLDTIIIRPILVPCWIHWTGQGRLSAPRSITPRDQSALVPDAK